MGQPILAWLSRSAGIRAHSTNTCPIGAAWILTNGQQTRLSDIHVVQSWPGAIEPKVPSRYTYSANDGHNWGYGIGDNAYVMEWTKLKLQRQTTAKALQGLVQTMVEEEKLSFRNNTQIPRHLIRDAPDVVTDYLYEVAKCVLSDIRSETAREAIMQFPMDFVITHPAVRNAFEASDETANLLNRNGMTGRGTTHSEWSMRPLANSSKERSATLVTSTWQPNQKHVPTTL